jgi:GTP pyrophosphokinase
VHRTDCPNLLQLADHRSAASRSSGSRRRGERFFVRIVMEGHDRRGLFADIASTISQTNTNIRSADIQADDAG